MQTSEKIGERIQSYLDGSPGSTIEADVRDILTYKPLNWNAFKALGMILESEGDASSARECYLGRIPLAVQARVFNKPNLESIYEDIAGNYVASHAPEVLNPISDAIDNTDCLAHYKNMPLRSAETGVYTYPKARCWFDGYNTTVFDTRGKVDRNTLIGNIAPVISASERISPGYINGQAILMGSQGSNNYFHWMTDVLPKFSVLEKSGVRLDGNAKYIFTNVTSKFQIDTLKHLGVRSEQIYCTLSEGSHIAADELLVPVLPNKMGLTMGSWLPAQIKEWYKVGESSHGGERKLLISRNAEKSHGRGVFNATEFNQYFVDKGYEIILPDEYSVLEQARLFAQATHVVGPHGAGLANLLFCEKGTQVYEFYGRHLAPCYWAISELSGLKYSNMNCIKSDEVDQSDLSKARTLGDRRSSGFEIDVSKLDDISLW